MGRQKRQLVNDFLVDTNGQCFICLTKVLSRYDSDIPGPRPRSMAASLSSSHHASVHALSRYIKMDMSRVFHEKESIPTDLLDNVKKSKLKVSLCGQCAKWNERISELCRQQERIQAETHFYVELIHESLCKSGGDNNNEIDVLPKMCHNSDDITNLNRGGLVERVRIFKSLRMEATQKCYQKLKDVQPKVKVQKMAPNQVISKQQRFWKHASQSPEVDDKKLSNPEKNVCSDTEQNIQEDDSYYDVDDDANFDSAAAASIDGTINGEEDESNNAQAGDKDSQNLTEVKKKQSGSAKDTDNQMQKKQIDLRTVTSEKILPSPLTIKKCRELDPDPNTGKYKCSLCLLEFSFRQGLQRHHANIHLKIKHKCKLCGKEFSHLSSYKTHHKTDHVGIRFKCDPCGKCFTQKTDLFRHQKAVHLGVRFKCTFCPKTYTQENNLACHVRASHRQ